MGTPALLFDKKLGIMKLILFGFFLGAFIVYQILRPTIRASEERAVRLKQTVKDLCAKIEMMRHQLYFRWIIGQPKEK